MPRDATMRMRQGGSIPGRNISLSQNRSSYRVNTSGHCAKMQCFYQSTYRTYCAPAGGSSHQITLEQTWSRPGGSAELPAGSSFQPHQRRPGQLSLARIESSRTLFLSPAGIYACLPAFSSFARPQDRQSLHSTSNISDSCCVELYALLRISNTTGLYTRYRLFTPPRKHHGVCRRAQDIGQ